MKNIFGVQKDNEKIDGQKYIVRSLSEQLVQERDNFNKEFEEHTKKASLPKFINIIRSILGFIFFFILIGTIKSLKEISLKEAFTNAPYLFIIAIVSLVAYITITFIGKKKLKKVLESDEFNSFNNNSETLLARLLNDLRISHDSKQVDVLLYAYSLNKNNKEKNMTALQMSKYINMELYLFKENDSLCLANLDEVVSIPLRDIKEIVKVNKKIDMMQWNKDEAYNKGRYKEYKITMNQYNIYFFKPYYSIRINDGTEEFEIIVPPYDIEFFNDILNLEIKESND